MSPRLALASGVLVAIATIGGPGPREARADTPPSVWDRAKDPSVTDTQRIHLEVERRLSMLGRLAQLGQRDVVDAQVRAVRAFLERYQAAESKDVRLRIDLARVHAALGDHDKAAKVYTSAVEAFPDHPAVKAAWNALAEQCGHIADHACERRAYAEVLRRETDDLHRATPTLNLAETEMHFGNLREAIDGYREALRIASRTGGRDTSAMAVWGLAVALDRSGDAPGALKEAQLAVELERSIGQPNLLKSDGVFFTPAWEIHWYEGLGRSASARVAKDPRDALALWRAAEQSFAYYVRFGEPAGDRWAALAKLRLAAIKVEREKAEKRAAREPSREVDQDEGTISF